MYRADTEYHDVYDDQHEEVDYDPEYDQVHDHHGPDGDQSPEDHQSERQDPVLRTWLGMWWLNDGDVVAQ